MLVLVVVFHAAGGWYFSTLLRTDGLEPRAGERNFDVRVVSIGPDQRISLDGTDRKAIEQPGVSGLWWPDGYGRIGSVLAVDGTVVTRAFELVSGSLPPICTTPETAACVEVDIDSHAFRSDPADVGLRYSDVAFQGPLGQLEAWLVTPNTEPASTWAIHVHGWRVDRREALRTLTTYGSLGVTSLVIEYRNDEGAPADPSGFYRFGRTEWTDLEGAVQFALDRGAERIVLAGYSTGAAVSLAFLENSAHADRVVGVVLDSPNIDFGTAVKLEAGRRKLPGTPIPLPPTLTATAMWLADVRFDVDWNAIDYVGRPDIVQVPTLVFHGTSDTTVPIDVSRDFAASNPLDVELVETTAEHVQSWNVDPDRYERRLGEFLADVL